MLESSHVAAKGNDQMTYTPIGRSRLGWIVLIAICNLVLVLGFRNLHSLDSEWITALFVLFWVANVLGVMWMVYKSIRYEAQPWLYVVLAFLPYTFTWYYAERVQKGIPARIVPVNLDFRSRVKGSSLWISVLILTGFDFWSLWGSIGKESLFVAFILSLFFAIPSAGMLWMLYQIIRYEYSVWPIIVLTSIPYSFVWYYFDRLRKSKSSYAELSNSFKGDI